MQRMLLGLLGIALLFLWDYFNKETLLNNFQQDMEDLLKEEEIKRNEFIKQIEGVAKRNNKTESSATYGPSCDWSYGDDITSYTGYTEGTTTNGGVRL